MILNILKNPGSAATLHRIDTKHPYRYACQCIVAYDIYERNPSDLGVALAEPRRILGFPQSPTSASARLDLLVAAGAVSKPDADDLKALGGMAAASGEPAPTSDPLFYIARYVAAHAVAEEVSSGVPGLWAAVVAAAEAQRPHARKAGEKSHG